MNGNLASNQLHKMRFDIHHAEPFLSVIIVFESSLQAVLVAVDAVEAQFKRGIQHGTWRFVRSCMLYRPSPTSAFTRCAWPRLLLSLCFFPSSYALKLRGAFLRVG